jgi:hypothetical protein
MKLKLTALLFITAITALELRADNKEGQHASKPDCQCWQVLVPPTIEVTCPASQAACLQVRKEGDWSSSQVTVTATIKPHDGRKTNTCDGGVGPIQVHNLTKKWSVEPKAQVRPSSGSGSTATFSVNAVGNYTVHFHGEGQADCPKMPVAGDSNPDTVVAVRLNQYTPCDPSPLPVDGEIVSIGNGTPAAWVSTAGPDILGYGTIQRYHTFYGVLIDQTGKESYDLDGEPQQSECDYGLTAITGSSISASYKASASPKFEVFGVPVDTTFEASWTHSSGACSFPATDNMTGRKQMRFMWKDMATPYKGMVVSVEDHWSDDGESAARGVQPVADQEVDLSGGKKQIGCTQRICNKPCCH